METALISGDASNLLHLKGRQDIGIIENMGNSMGDAGKTGLSPLLTTIQSRHLDLA